jgi:pimeloyl-ACP methyl ester carboxylesterase
MNKTIRKIGVVVGAVAMTGFAAPLLLPLPPLEGTVPPEDLADPDSRFIRFGSLNVHFKRRGTGKPIFVFLHGYLGGTFSWQQIFDAMAQSATAIVYDRPAFGLTTRPMPGDWEGPNPYGMDAQVRFLIALLDALDVDHATLIAHGIGCGVAAMASRLHPDRVERLVLVSPETKGQGRPGWQRLFMATPQMRRLGPVLWRNKVIGQLEEILQKGWHNPSLVSPEKRDAYYKILRVDNWDRALWEFARATRPDSQKSPPETIRAPTLVVAGESDRIEGTEEIVRFAAAIPQANLAVLPDAGYCPQEEAPEAFLQAIAEYLTVAPGPAQHA